MAAGDQILQALISCNPGDAFAWVAYMHFFPSHHDKNVDDTMYESKTANSPKSDIDRLNLVSDSNLLL